MARQQNVEHGSSRAWRLRPDPAPSVFDNPARRREPEARSRAPGRLGREELVEAEVESGEPGEKFESGTGWPSFTTRMGADSLILDPGVKPNNDDAPLPFDSRPFRVLVISGSQRRQYNCPGAPSRAR
ncbi:MAG TPA: hypothetical protein VFS20_16305 [Longimicrobium sp.]|nr:hypothetical protein [Longimicrobium sp.]